MRLLATIALLSVSLGAQTVAIEAPIFSGSGLNDASSGGQFASSAANASYKAVICATGTPDTFKSQKNGGAFSACSAITGTAQAVGDGVTITFAATTGHTAADSWTIAANANGSLSAENFAQTGIGARISRPAEEKAREILSVRDFGVIGSASDSTQFFAEATAEAARLGKIVYLPASPYPYLICPVSYVGNGNVAWRGEGMKSSLVQPTAACANQNANMIHVDTTGSVEFDGIGFDMKTNGVVQSKAIIDIANARGVTITRNEIAHAQSVGVQCTNCSDVRNQGNHYYQNWWFGISVACDGGPGGTGPTPPPVYLEGFSDSGNVYEDTPFGAGYNFYCRNISVTGNAFTKSALALIQTPDAKAAITGNSFNGSASYGCSYECGIVGPIGGPAFTGTGLNDAFSAGTYTATASHTYTAIVDSTGATDTFKWQKDTGAFVAGVPMTTGWTALADGVLIRWGAKTGHTIGAQWVINARSDLSAGNKIDGIFLEGTRNVSIGKNRISNTGQNGVLCQGSRLQLAGSLGTGTQIDLPCINNNIEGADFDHISNGYPVLISATSNGTSPTRGTNNTVRGGTITDSQVCGSVSDFASVVGNTCTGTQVGGWTFSNGEGRFEGNELHNIGLAFDNTYDGFEINGSSQNIVILRNWMHNDAGLNRMRYGVNDKVWGVGTPDHVTGDGNQFRPGVVLPWTPVPSLPTSGTYDVGEVIQSTNPATTNTAGWINTQAGTYGTGTVPAWMPLSRWPDSLGYYSSFDPLDKTKVVKYGINHATGEGEIQCLDTSVSGFKSCRITGIGLKIINGNTGAQVAGFDASGNLNAASLVTGGPLQFGGTLTPPTGTALNGSSTCPAGQAVTQIVDSQGITTGVTCSTPAVSLPGGSITCVGTQSVNSVSLSSSGALTGTCH